MLTLVVNNDIQKSKFTKPEIIDLLQRLKEKQKEWSVFAKENPSSAIARSMLLKLKLEIILMESSLKNHHSSLAKQASAEVQEFNKIVKVLENLKITKRS